MPTRKTKAARLEEKLRQLALEKLLDCLQNDQVKPPELLKILTMKPSAPVAATTGPMKLQLYDEQG